MTAIESVHSLLNLKYAGIFSYMNDTVFMIKRNKEIYIRIGYFEKGT